ncbi:MAG: tetratricopeptide repeat protein, partial [Saprospiraceae bacterium]
MKSPYFTKKGKYSLTLLTVSCLLLCIPRAITQADLLTEARELSYNGNYQEADSLFRKLIAADSLNTEAILGSAYNKSWHEHREEALIEFGKVLKIDPKNKSAFIGLGYTLAWNKDYANAKYPFLNALSLYPKDPEAEKGLAYVYLWQGSPDVALEMFANLNKRDPSDAEYYVALALAHIQKYETIEARKLLDKALMIDPANTAATDVKSSLRYASPMVELDIWGGYSHINTSSRFGLRNVQISVQVSRSLRALLTYDNALSLDNLFFINKNYNAETFMAGGIMSWNKSNISRLQSGYRNLDAQGVQWLLSGEHSISFNDHKILKAGGL